MNKIAIYQQLPNFIKSLLASFYGMRLQKRRTYLRATYEENLKERSTWTQAEYLNWQKNEIAEMLVYAAQKVPYYRNYWTGKDQTNIRDINAWPILEKDIVRNHPTQFISDDFNIKDLSVMHTSGTSGKPMTIYLSKESVGLWYALYDIRIKKENGVDPLHDAYGTFAGQLVCAQNETKPPFWVHNQFGKQVYFSSYHLNDKNIDSYVKAIFDYKLTYLMGYTSALHSVVVLAKAKNIQLPKLKLVITNAEPLFDHQRELISTAFQCPVVQTYSGCEFAFGGTEDLQKNMWLWPESGLLEVLTDDGQIQPFGQGAFLATGLVNKAMPLIRYKIGDSGTIENPEITKSKGNMLQLTSIDGRTDDLIKTPDGRLVGRLDPVFKADFAIKEAQIIQEKLNLIILKVVEDIHFNEAQKNELIDRLKDRVGDGMEVKYESVKSIERNANGKFKAVISMVN
jgi:phenylacetate-CoA ligase